MAPTNEKTPEELCEEINDLRKANYDISLDLFDLERSAQSYRISLAKGAASKLTDQYRRKLADIEEEIRDSEESIHKNNARIAELKNKIAMM